MKKWYLIFILFVSCSIESPLNEPVNEVRDTIAINRVLTLIDSLHTDIDSLHTENKELKSERDEERALIDTLQLQVKSGQLSKLELIIAEKRLRKTKINNIKLIQKIDSIEKINQTLVVEKNIVMQNLQNEKAYSKKITYENNASKAKIESASKLDICCESINAYGYRRRLNPKNRDSITDRFETDKAAKVKQVVVSFKIPKNKLFTPKWYEIIAIIKGSDVVPDGIKEKLGFDYNGSEQQHDIPFNKSIDWQISNHTVLLLLNNDTLYRGNLNLK